MHPDIRRQLPVKILLLLITALLFTNGVTAQKQGQEQIDSLVKALADPKADTAQVMLLLAIGNQYLGTNPDTGLYYAAKGLALSQRLHWKKGIANAYNIMGNCTFSKSAFAEATEYYNKAIKIFGEDNDKRGLLKAIGNLGNVNICQSEYSKALEHNFLALKYAEELNDTVSITINLGNIGATYEYLADFDKGLEYDFKALKLLEVLHDSVNIALTLGNIGNLYSDKHQYGQALGFQQKALDYHNRLGNPEPIARDFMNIGTIYSDMHQYDQAIGAYFKALELSRQTDFKILESNILTCLGEALTFVAMQSQKNTPDARSAQPAADYHMPAGKAPLLRAAIQYLKQSIAIDLSLNNLNGLQNSYRILSTAQRQAGLPLDALDSKDKYIAIKDSVFSLDSKLKIANLETKRELDLKDKQIELDRLAVAKKRNERVFFIAGILLLLAVVGIVIRNMKLSAARALSENKLQTFQARMNPHFIFNSLNSIQSLVLNNETISSITYLSRFSKLMRQILDSSASSKVLLQTELRMLQSYIELEQLRFERFTFEIILAPGVAPDAVEIPAMIIQPFVENAIIHGILPKKEDGRLTVTLEREWGRIICTVDDNGIGRKRSAALNQGRSKEHQSHGISIAVNRLALLGRKGKGPKAGVTYIDKEEHGIPAGTRVILQIPVL